MELERPVGLEAEAQTQLCAESECYDLERMLGEMMLLEDHWEDIVHILDTEREEEEQGEPHCQVRPYPCIESWYYMRTGLKAVRDERFAAVAWALDSDIEGSQAAPYCHKACPLG